MAALGSTLLQGCPEHDAVPAASAGLGGLGCPTTGARDRLNIPAFPPKTTQKNSKECGIPYDHYHNDILVGLNLLFYYLSLFSNIPSAI